MIISPTIAPYEEIKKKVDYYKQLLLSVGISEASLMGSFIAGGCLRSLVLNEQVKDVDIFCHNDQVIEKIRKELTSKGDILTYLKYAAIESDNAITFSVDGVQFQVIKVKTGQPTEVIGEFDFEMNMNYFEFVSDVPYFHNIHSIVSKTLTINPNCRNKLGTLARLEKFLKRGYNIGNKLNLLELGTQISKLEPVITFSQLETESKLYFTFEEYESADFVEKDAASVFRAKYIGSAF